MKDKLIKKLKRLNCPNEYSLDCKCVGNCPIEQMGDCWDKVFERYELLILKEPIYKHQWNGISFAFKRKNGSMKLIRADGKHYGLTEVEFCPHCGKMICPDIISKMFECNYCHHCGCKVEY